MGLIIVFLLWLAMSTLLPGRSSYRRGTRRGSQPVPAYVPVVKVSKPARPLPPVTEVRKSKLQWSTMSFGTTDVPSPAEQLIIDELNKYSVYWKREVSFTALQLATGGFARYDFYLPDHNTLIEYNSKQYHTSPDRIAVDQIKKKFCEDNGIVLVVYTHKDYYFIERRVKLLMNQLGVRLI